MRGVHRGRCRRRRAHCRRVTRQSMAIVLWSGRTRPRDPLLEQLQQFPIPPPHLWQVRKNASPARIYARGIRLRIAILHAPPAFFPRARRASSSDGVPHTKSSRPGETTPAIHAKPSSRPGDSTPATIHIFDGGGS